MEASLRCEHKVTEASAPPPRQSQVLTAIIRFVNGCARWRLTASVPDTGTDGRVRDRGRDGTGSVPLSSRASVALWRCGVEGVSGRDGTRLSLLERESTASTGRKYCLYWTERVLARRRDTHRDVGRHTETHTHSCSSVCLLVHHRTTHAQTLQCLRRRMREWNGC